MASFLSYKRLSPSYRVFLTHLDSTAEVQRTFCETVTQAVRRHTINNEMEALKRNEMWELVNLPAVKNMIQPCCI